MHSKNVSLIFPLRTGHYGAFSEILFKERILGVAILGTRNGFPGLPFQNHRLMPIFGGLRYATFRTLPTGPANFLNYASFVLFDRLAEQFLPAGDHVYTSFAYGNRCMRRAKRCGGVTLLDGGNAHPAYAHRLLEEERKLWGLRSALRPLSYVNRCIESVELADFVFSPSSFVKNSFLAEGFPGEKILDAPYPVDFGIFSPDPARVRPPERPLTLICSGMCSLRKGTPYLLEAFRLVRRQVPDARLLLCRSFAPDMQSILPRFSDLPIEWFAPCAQPRLRELLLGADIFVLPTLEEGLVRTALEAMACDLPVVLTPHAGANDFVLPGINGDVVPIRDPQSTADAILEWWHRLQSGQRVKNHGIREALSFESYQRHIVDGLKTAGILQR